MANMRQGERTDLEPSADLRNVISQPEAAELLNISERSIQDAKSAFRNRKGARMANMQRTDTLKRGPRSPDSDDGVSLQGAADLLNVTVGREWKLYHCDTVKRGHRAHKFGGVLSTLSRSKAIVGPFCFIEGGHKSASRSARSISCNLTATL